MLFFPFPDGTPSRSAIFSAFDNDLGTGELFGEAGILLLRGSQFGGQGGRADTGRTVDRVRGKLHGYGDNDPSAPSRVNFRGVCVSSSLARRAVSAVQNVPAVRSSLF